MPLFEASFPSILSSGHPYLNPGTGGLLIQLILGALFATGLTTRIFWSKIKHIFAFKSSGGVAAVSKNQDDIR